MRVKIAILAYDNATRITDTVRRFYFNTLGTGLDEVSLHIFDAGYPLPSVEENRKTLLSICGALNVKYTRIENRGQDGNIKRIGELLAEHNFDVCAFYDADVFPRSEQWLLDACRVFFYDPDCDFVTMNCKITDDALCQQGPDSLVGGVSVARLKWPGGWPVLIFRKSFLVHGYQATHSFYGGTEGNILNQLTVTGKHGYMMKQHDDARELSGIDPEYNEWKHYAIDKRDAMSFEEWLADRKSARG